MLFQPTFLILLSSLPLDLNALALPPDTTSNKGALHRRAWWDDSSPIPLVEGIEKQLHFEPSTALFFSEDIDEKTANAYAKSRGLKTLQMGVVKGDTPWNTNKWTGGGKTKWLDSASVAMLHVISGTLHVMLPGGLGDPWPRGSTWDRKVWPVLQANTGNGEKYTRLLRVNPEGVVLGQLLPGPLSNVDSCALPGANPDHCY